MWRINELYLYKTSLINAKAGQNQCTVRLFNALVTKIGRCPGIGGNREHTGGFCNFSDIGQHR